MILTFDIGNANIALCCVDNGEKLCSFCLSTNDSRTPDEYVVIMSLLAERRGIDLKSAAGAVIASVVPQLTPVISAAVETLIGKQPLLVGPGVKSGLNIRMDSPGELGCDLVAAAVAAIEKYPLPCIIIDMGAATAVGVIDAAGCYIGGLICPGIALSHSGLASGASQLPNVSLAVPKRVIGKNTVDSMQSGLIHGSAAMLDGVIDRVEAELGSAATVVVTGHDAGVLLPFCRRSDMIHDEDLIMRGLWSIYCRNRDKR
ncbi:MAG: type III pantothenate kinase [Ruminococcaceae bacterium]|nr:type III pantothenate kinase [Oscillospiraceae bacterium]